MSEPMSWWAFGFLLIGVVVMFFTLMEAPWYARENMEQKRGEPGLIYLIRIPLTMWVRAVFTIASALVVAVVWLVKPRSSNASNSGGDDEQ